MEYLGRYKLLERIAIGGMAEIFLAEQPGPAGFSRRVAIKRILPHRADDAEFVEMFLNEARLSALLNHPNIVQIYDLGEVDGAYYIAMEYVDGFDLGQVLDKCLERRELVNAAYAAKMIAQAAAGLNYAHGYADLQTGQPLNLIHRDISLPNIMISKEGVVKVLDFGIAKGTTTEQRAPTQTGVLKGKISYMSPEYLMGERIDWRHDLFALGVVMFELVTGEKPFQAKGDVQMLQAILTQPPRDPYSLNSSLPRGFVDILMRMLAKDPRERFQNGSEIQHALDSFVYEAVGGEITHQNLSSFVQALFHHQPLPEPSHIAEKKAIRPHMPATSQVAAFRPHTPAPSAPGLPPLPSHSQNNNWMEETRAIPINTSALQGIEASLPGPNLAGVTEQTAMLDISALGGTLDAPNGLVNGQPQTAELDHSMLPDLPAEEPVPEVLSPMTKAMDAVNPEMTLPPQGAALESPAVQPSTPQAGDGSVSIPKWMLFAVPLFMIVGGLAVFFLLRWLSPSDADKKKKMVAMADAGADRTAPVATRRRNVQPPPQRRPQVLPDRKSAVPPVPPVRRPVKKDAGGDAPPLPVFSNQRRVPPLPGQRTATPPPTRRLKYGVYLKSFPRCKVFWQGRDWGYTPLELPMTPGTHNIMLRRGRPVIRYPYQITLQENEYLQKTVYIGQGRLYVRATPWAKVSVDGHYIGTTPILGAALYAGYHRLTVKNETLKKYRSRLIVIPSGGKRKIKFKFK